jgi:voltage-gated potassium channel
MNSFWNIILHKYLYKYLQKIHTLSLSLVMSLFGFIWICISYFVYVQEVGAEGANIKSFEDGLWWGVVTFLTVGYGDRFPVTLTGRILGVALMFCGVLVISLMTARISTIFFEAALKKRRGIVETDLLQDHFVICGWTDDMEELLFHILEFNDNLESRRVVVLANVDENTRETILAHPRLEDIGFINGEYYTEAQLRRAAPQRARKVLILADRTTVPGAPLPTAVEIDARTIMAAISLSNIARGTMVAAEILDPKMAQYLKIAGVSEIIYSREYSRLLIGNASGGTGVVNILYDLLDPTTPSKISTIPLASEFIGKTYQEIKATMEEAAPDLQVVGILENFGNQQSIKEHALRKAQQTPDINQLVNNLQAIREIKCNYPLFNPGPGYVVHEGSLIIGIENRVQGVKHGIAPRKADSPAA